MSQPTLESLQDRIEHLQFHLQDQLIQLSNLKHEFSQYRERQLLLDKKLIERQDAMEKQIARLSKSNVTAIH